MQRKNGAKTPDQLIGKLQIALKNIRNETENERKWERNTARMQHTDKYIDVGQCCVVSNAYVSRWEREYGKASINNSRQEHILHIA